MSTLGFWGKIYRSMWTGSMMGCGPEVQSIMSYVIAHSEKGQVELNPKLLSAVIGMPEEATEKAIAFLCSPDPRSRNKDHDGARLIKTGTFSYAVTGWDKYHPSANVEDRREYMREAKRRQRQRDNGQEPPAETPPQKPPTIPASVDPKRLAKLRTLCCERFKRAPAERWEYIEETSLVEVAKRPSCIWEFKAICRMIDETIEPKFMSREMKNLGDFLANWRKLLDQAASSGYEAKEEFGRPDSERINICGFIYTRTDGGPRREQFNNPAWPTAEKQENAFRASRTAYDQWVRETAPAANAPG